ncbi:metallophosphoesterase [Tundrisphaera lichenicola]|uniref:metallophosphoesterase n=1 Tax=Tundrisphaera lichenicola TaxID=2029860 RepID=UPI003EB9F059
MPHLPWPLILGSTLIDAVIAYFTLFVRLDREAPANRTRAIGVGRVSLAILTTSAGFVIKLLVLKRFGVDLFGWIHLAYLDLVILVPVIGGFLLLSRMTQAGPGLTPLVRIAATVSLVLPLVGIYATWIEPFRLRLESATLFVSAAREGIAPLRIGVLTDLQTDRVSDHERRAVALLMSQKPDLILLPGDVFQGTGEQFEATRSGLRDLLGSLSAPGGVYLVLGDTDGSGDHLREILRSTEIRVLENEIARGSVGDRKFAIGGVELAHSSEPPQHVIDRLEETGDEAEIRILLAHRPDVALGLRPGSRIDLVVAGHTHGGQIVVPWFGPLMTLSQVPRSVAAGGLHRISGNPVYVSRGVGAERAQAPRIRFLCAPEVSVIELRSGPPDSIDSKLTPRGR